MKKYSSKIWVLMLALVFAAGTVLAGCSGSSNNGNPQAGNETAGGGEATQEPLQPGETRKFDPPIKLTAIASADEQIFFDGDTLNNNPHTRWAREKFGIDIEYVIEPASGGNLQQRLQLMMASGERLPDIVNYYSDPVFIGQLIDSGQFIPVGDLIEKYAGDIYKAHVEQNPHVFYPYTKDGEIYGIPVLEYARNNNTILWFREDWLQKLNLQAPTTIEELENVMHQFKYNNPEGYDPEEVTPLVLAMRSGGKGWMATADWIFGAYGSVHQQWNMTEEGTLEYGSITPGAKQALAKLNEWFDKGYISKEVAMATENAAATLISSGKAGILPGANWAPDWPLPDALAVHPHADFQPYPVPAGPDGHIGTLSDNDGVNGVVLIHKDFAHPEAFFMYYNYLLENLADPEYGSEYELGFAQGYDWDVVDGVPTNDRSLLERYSNSFNFLTGIARNPARIPNQFFDALIKLADGGEAETPYEKQTELTRTPTNWYAAKVVMLQEDVRKINYFNAAPTPTMIDRWDLLYQSELETYNKIIYGQSPLDSFDTFVATWNSNGGAQIVEEVNEWFKSVTVE